MKGSIFISQNKKNINLILGNIAFSEVDDAEIM
jgi:hypothetical protein